MPRKLVLDCDDETWKKVLMYKIEKELKNNNEAVNMLLKKALKNKK